MKSRQQNLSFNNNFLNIGDQKLKKWEFLSSFSFSFNFILYKEGKKKKKN
jgi:hypothetical protein